MPNVSLVAGLEARGAMVESFKVYRWDLPEDAGPLRANIKRLAEGGLDVAMFTSAQQVVHLLRVAKELGLEAQVRDAFRRTVVASVGPTTSEMLRANGLPPLERIERTLAAVERVTAAVVRPDGTLPMELARGGRAIRRFGMDRRLSFRWLCQKE